MLSYSQQVTDFFDNPRNAGVLCAPAHKLGIGTAGKIRTGVQVKFQLRIDSGVISEARYHAYGCPHTIAAAEWVAQHVRGRYLTEMTRLDPHQIALELDIPAEKLGSLFVIEDAFKASIMDWRKRQRELRH